MRVTLVFPPSMCLPNALYFALPTLAGVLKEAGHRTRLVDLNLLAADRLLTVERCERLLAAAQARVAATPDGAAARRLRRVVASGAPAVQAGPQAKADLRNPRRAFDPEVFGRSFWTIVDALGF
ncbi:MAG TPA: hypothetical protein VEI02_14115, partial [Planctomycetota bacterium]|nr:hypothetical protein [Planctomycetota bacterium]